MKKIYLLFILLLLPMVSCGLPAAVEDPAAPKQAALAGDGPSSSEYPTSPEGVVQAYLTAFSADPNLMPLYVSSSQLQLNGPGGALSLLQAEGVLEGYAIESAAVSPETKAAEVTIAMRISGSDSARKFNLVLEQDRWAIDAIEVEP